MKRNVLFAFLLIIMFKGYGQKVENIDKKGLLTLLSHNNDTTYVVNFWATWCSPCVAEIGYFEELHRTYADRKLKVFLVNLDFPNQVDRRVIPFMEEKKLTALVLNMAEMNYNSWIPDVDSDWSGAIPATLIYKGKKREFIGKEISRKELFEAVDAFPVTNSE